MSGNVGIGTGTGDSGPRFQQQNRYMDHQTDFNQVRALNQASCANPNTWIYNRARPLLSWNALKRRQDELAKAKEDAERLHESLKQQHESQWTEQSRLLELRKQKSYSTDRHENDSSLNNNISFSSEANDKKQVVTKSKKKYNKKGKKSGEALKKAEDSDMSEKNYESGEKEERELVNEQDSETKDENFVLCKETQNKLDKDFDDRLNKLNKLKEKTIQDHLKREQQIEKDRSDFLIEFERHLAEMERKSRNMPSARALRDRIHYMEREVSKKDHVLTDMQVYMLELENKIRFMNNTISRLQQEVSDFQFEKLQLNNQIVEKDSQLSLIMNMNPHIMLNLQGFTDTVYYDCPEQPAGPQPVEEIVETPIISTSLIDIRDRYDDLLAEFPENEEVNWTLTMISKIVDYYETIGKSVYEEVAPNKYVSTIIFADKSDPIPNKFEGTVAVGNGDTPLEATQCAVQWAYGYIQSCATSDSNGNGVLKDPESVTSSPPLSENINGKTMNMNEDGSENSDEFPKNTVEKDFYFSDGSVGSTQQQVCSENLENPVVCNGTKPLYKDILTVSSDLEKNQTMCAVEIEKAENFFQNSRGAEKRLYARCISSSTSKEGNNLNDT